MDVQIDTDNTDYTLPRLLLELVWNKTSVHMLIILTGTFVTYIPISHQL